MIAQHRWPSRGPRARDWGWSGGHADEQVDLRKLLVGDTVLTPTPCPSPRPRAAFEIKFNLVKMNCDGCETKPDLKQAFPGFCGTLVSGNGPFPEGRSFRAGRASPRQPGAPPQRPRVHIPRLAHPREQLPSPNPRMSKNLGPSPPC